MRISRLTAFLMATLLFPVATQVADAACPAPLKQGLDRCNSSGSDLQALQMRGITCFGAGEYRRSIAAFNEAIRKGCGDVCLLNRSRAKLSMGDLDGALGDFDELRRSSGQTPHRLIAIAYYKKKDFDRAVVEADRALQRRGDDVEALYLRGLAKVAKGDAANGRADQEAAKVMNAKAQHPIPDLQQYFECTHRT